ncbi:thioredoxin domain-containing protein 11 isoform X2 [Chanos chanos]|uniref:Thioredoxin domain-containing protein 11 isoform X2 n=1 Tax=Chanos chanos TaxID=29144 RepID=A0A6J2VVG4_CHACN|nr:thioredoxin domain-containing protein 11 isoform X2 [Chanos chanos]
MLRRLRLYLRQLVTLMARRPGVFCGAVVLSCLLILAVKLTCSRAKNVVAAARAPVRFFAGDVPVVDLYLGQVEQVERLRGASDISVIFYYAPWCAHSINARDQLQHVAHSLFTQVQFVAVNCWWNQGKCRRQKNFYQYPVIHLYYRRFGPIDYKGPFHAAYVEKFIQRVISPLTYLPTQSTLRDFLSHHEPGVVGFFDFNTSPQPPGYLTFLSAALQALQRDSQGAVRFGVVTNQEVAQAISLREDESVYLHRRLNHSLLFPRSERNFTAEELTGWVFEHRETLLHWLQPNGAKSHTLEEELQKGPALLMFLPHNPLGANHELLTVADVAVRYHSCCRSSVPGASLDHPAPPSVILPQCGSTLLGQLCCNSLLLPTWSSVSRGGLRVCELCLNRSKPGPGSSLGAGCSLADLDAALESYLRRGSVWSQSLAPSCSHVRYAYSPFTHYSACCRSLLTAATDGQTGATDGQTGATDGQTGATDGQTGATDGQTGATDGQTAATDGQTGATDGQTGATDGQTGVQRSEPSSPHQPVEDCPLLDALTGLRCRTNKTLRFYLLDSNLHWTLARRLGAEGNVSEHAFATIVNLRDETHYVLNQTDSLRDSLEYFIRNFSSPHSVLPRHLVGRTQLQPPQSLIQEMTTHTFLPTVMDPEKDVLVLYYSRWCGFCAVWNHVLLQMSQLFHSTSFLTISRVNVALNDLPWEFMVDHVPTLLLFPRHRKQMSVKFPENTPITLPNLVRFVLKYSGHTPQGTGLGAGPRSLLQAELQVLQGEVLLLQQAKDRLSQQLTALWRENQQLSLHTRSLESQNALLQEQSGRLEAQFREKSRQLSDALQRLEELASVSEHLLTENSLLKVLLSTLRERQMDGQRNEEKQMEDGESGKEEAS